MAIARSATVVEAQKLGADTLLLKLVPQEPLGFIGGQYVIVDSGLVLASGKGVKRAYSILSPDEEQDRFELAVKQIRGGRGSSFVHALAVGDNVRFSGPWGKLFPKEAARGRTLVIATDTGISAVLGLVQSARFEPLLRDTTLIWLRTSEDYFLPESLVRARVPSICAETRIEALPPIGRPERVSHARALLTTELTRCPLHQAFLAGDGAVNYAVLDDLVTAGIVATKDNVESFFNMPKKSS